MARRPLTAPGPEPKPLWQVSAGGAPPGVQGGRQWPSTADAPRSTRGGGSFKCISDRLTGEVAPDLPGHLQSSPPSEWPLLAEQCTATAGQCGAVLLSNGPAPAPQPAAVTAVLRAPPTPLDRTSPVSPRLVQFWALIPEGGLERKRGDMLGRMPACGGS